LRTYNQTGSYLALIYTDTKLIASTDNSTLVIFSENGTLLQEILISEGNVNLLSKHNHNGEGYSLSEDVVGISNGTYLIHYVNGSIDFNQLISK
jgi:antitoxin component YwqK of YwqJK toxin-antitoxin module